MLFDFIFFLNTFFYVNCYQLIDILHGTLYIIYSIVYYSILLILMLVSNLLKLIYLSIEKFEQPRTVVNSTCICLRALSHSFWPGLEVVHTMIRSLILSLTLRAAWVNRFLMLGVWGSANRERVVNNSLEEVFDTVFNE